MSTASDIEIQAEIDSSFQKQKPVIPRHLQQEEFILNPENKRYTLHPVQYPLLLQKYHEHFDAIWGPDEIDLSGDKKDWDALTDGARHFIKYVLAFFAASDGIVMENLNENFSNEVQILEAKNFYAMQSLIEAVHSETYSQLIDSYITDSAEKQKLFNALETLPCVQAKGEWAKRWMNDESSFAERLLAFGAVEGIFFSGSFCAIYWLKKQGKMPGLTFSNELISRDENLHVEFACLLYSMLKHKLSQKTVENIVCQAVKIEKSFIIDAIPVALIGMNAGLMSQYIEFVADRYLVQLGYKKVYNALNPFDWMEMISMRKKGNFFEIKIGEYNRANKKKQVEATTTATTNPQTATGGDSTFCTTADF